MCDISMKDIAFVSLVFIPIVVMVWSATVAFVISVYRLIKY
mgnify:CR=1 FL=1